MYVLKPITITAGMIQAGTSIDEPAAGETAWTSVGTYTVGDLRIRSTTHKVYECVQASTGRTALPENDPAYWLEKGPSEISYGDIVRITRGSLALVPCAARLAYEPCDNCVPESECHLRLVMLAVRDATADVLDRLTLADPPPGTVALSPPPIAAAAH